MRVARYGAFGLTIDSAVDLAPLPPVDLAGFSAGDLVVRRAEVPASLEGARRRGLWWEAAPGRYLLRVDGVGRFGVRDGDRVDVDAEPDADARSVALRLTGPVMAAVLHLRGLLVLHASAVAAGDGGAVAFAGRSGVGKSTLAWVLRAAGARFVSDDICAVRLDGAAPPAVLPAYPYAKLWPDALARHPDVAVSPLAPGIDKLVTPVDGLRAEVPLRRLYELVEDVTAGRGARLTRLAGQDVFTALGRVTHGAPLLAGFDLQGRHFGAVAAVARHVEVVQVRRSPAGCPVDELAELILRDLEW